jgi:hypothetical protein
MKRQQWSSLVTQMCSKVNCTCHMYVFSTAHAIAKLNFTCQMYALSTAHPAAYNRTTMG